MTATIAQAPAYQLEQLVQVRFPRLNKNDTIRYNDEQIKERSSVERCKIKKLVVVGEVDFAHFAQTLMHDRDWLWGNIGGTDLSIEDTLAFDELCELEHCNPRKLHSWLNNDRLKAWYMAHRHIEVVAVINENTGESFFVNTEGYKYARYVGRAA